MKHNLSLWLRIGFVSIQVWVLGIVLTPELAQAQPGLHWAGKMGAPGFDDHGTGITVDRFGNVFLTGHFGGVATFGGSDAFGGTFELESAYQRDAFIMKLNTEGEIEWVLQAKGPFGDVFGLGITAGEGGDVFLTGMFHSEVSIGSSTLTGGGSGDVFVARIDSFGKVLWAVAEGRERSDAGMAIAADRDGGVYVTGFVDASPGQALDHSDGKVFLAKYDSETGRQMWFKSDNPRLWGSGMALAADPWSGGILMAGYYIDVPNSSETSRGGDDAFVARYGPGSDLHWLRTAGGTAHDRALGVAIDDSEMVYLTGTMSNPAEFGELNLPNIDGPTDIFIARYRQDGELDWASRDGGGGADDVGLGIAVKGVGLLFVTGSFEGDAFVARYQVTTGDRMWLNRSLDTGPADIDAGLSVAISGTSVFSTIHICGYFRGNSLFGHSFDFDQDMMSSPDEDEIFVAQFGPTLPDRPE